MYDVNIYIYVYVCIYAYTERERRKRERDVCVFRLYARKCVCLCIYVYVYAQTRAIHIIPFLPSMCFLCGCQGTHLCVIESMEMTSTTKYMTPEPAKVHYILLPSSFSPSFFFPFVQPCSPLFYPLFGSFLPLITPSFPPSLHHPPAAPPPC